MDGTSNIKLNIIAVVMGIDDEVALSAIEEEALKIRDNQLHS